MGNSLLDALGYVGETLDKPGAAMRGLLAGRPGQLANLLPFSDTMGLTDPEQRVSGRGLLEHYGLVDPKQEGEGFDAGDLAGIGAQIATDPMTYLLGGGGAMLGHRFARNSADAANVSRRIADLAKETYEPISQAASAGAQAAEQVAPKLALPALPTALPAPTPPFYSRLQRAIQESDANNFKTQGLVDRLLKGKIGSQGNIHPEEIEYSKLAEALEGKPTISKQDLLAHVEQNTPKIGKTVYQHHPLQAEYNALEDRIAKMSASDPEYDALNQKLGDMAGEIASVRPSIPTYENYATPGGRNYRETLLTLPEYKGGSYESPHFRGVDNPILHMRTSEFDLPSGQKTLHAHEFQSELHQAGKKMGYGDQPLKVQESGQNQWRVGQGDNSIKIEHLPSNGAYVVHSWGGNNYVADSLEEATQEATRQLRNVIGNDLVPDAPFKEDWHRLAIKQLLQEAVENNIRTVTWSKGKDVASYTGGKLSGQEQFYDKATANLFSKMFGKYGGKVTEGEIPTVVSDQGWEGVAHSPTMRAVHQFDIPEALQKEIAMKGQSLWALLGALGLGGAAMEGQS